MNERLHIVFHLDARRRRNFVIVDDHGAGIVAQPVNALSDDAIRLTHLLDTNQVAIVAVAVHADRNIEIHLIVDFVRLLLAQVPLDA